VFAINPELGLAVVVLTDHGFAAIEPALSAYMADIGMPS
jgi:hypothetical protein